MSQNEITEPRSPVYTRRIARPNKSSKLKAQSSRQTPKLPRGFVDLDQYRAMMQRLVRLKHRREFRYWGPGGHKRGDA